jgi:hypothetical protein
MRAELIAEAQLPPRSSVERRIGGWLVHVPGVEIRAFNESLVELARFPLETKERGTHAVHPNLGYAALSEQSCVRCVDQKGRTLWQVEHSPWGRNGSESGSCWVSPDGRHVWATVPSSTDGPDEWWVLDGTSGRRLGLVELECYAAGSHPLSHPDGHHVGLSVGEGQDGAEIYWGHWEKGEPVVTRLDSRDHVLVDVRPDGTQFLTTPHSSDAEGIATHHFPGGPIAHLRSAANTFPDDDSFDYIAGYLSNNLILAASVEHQMHVVLSAVNLSVLGTVAYPSDDARELLPPLNIGRWLTGSFTEGTLQLWSLSTGSDRAAR